MTVDAPAAEVPSGPMDRVLGLIPRALASHVHIVGLIVLGVVLVVLPLLGVHVSTQVELIGGNYTNTTSDIGACIAAGGTLHLIRRDRRRHTREAEMHAMLTRLHGAVFPGEDA